MENINPIFIGFFPKKTQCPRSFKRNTQIAEICSVSDHISAGPEDWINKWKHNTIWWLYDTEDIAAAVIGADKEAYDLYAYKIYPVVFDGETEKKLTIETTASESLRDYDFLGYDIVSRSEGTSFECSPLSCNYGYKEYKVNKYCLIDDFNKALRITKEIARDSKEKGSWEPGPYYLLEVYRKQKNKEGLTTVSR